MNNVYKKLQASRVELQNMKLKKSGKNNYSNFTYYELGDFLPAVNALCDKNGLFTRFSIVGRGNEETAVLTVFNTDGDDSVVFTSPTAEVEIGKKKDGTGGAEPIQNLGGKITYLRRYMLMIAFEMVESDRVEQINRELVNEVEKEDLDRIKNTKSLEKLTNLYDELNKKYKRSLILEPFKKQRIILEQDGSEA